ncbi:MAG: tRNA (adenosine(37)-N6)-threonylcarbamoyltransferase complex ATPase subunit type 1 TsaE [Sphingomonadales bacterium]|nr:tRNA (adenosine(37)-N6)-threonylcarbamoyltransferase complex ATPase subunit type 1 TsaE [Sphingomonadales bacterium]
MILKDAEATEAAGRILAPYIGPGDVVALSGDLGVGKTCFVRGVLAGLGFDGEAPSPSFALVIPYAPPSVRFPVCHVDLYRLRTSEEAEELGLDDALADSALLIEWPERLGDRLWWEALKIRLDDVGPKGRRLTVSVPPSWEARCPFL